MAGKNFSIIIADSGHALLLDCGLFSKPIFETLFADMQKHLGLKQIDACWISHMHGDHFTLAPSLKEHGVKLWTLESIVDKCEHPQNYDYPALIESYGLGFDSARIDRAIHSGEVIEWEGYTLHVDWMPGQTEFGNCLWLELDGKRIAFTGDNLFGNPADPAQNGHECVVARNSAILEEGYQVGSKYLQKLKPDIVMGAHSILMTEPAAFLDRYAAWAERMSGLYREMLPDPDYAYLYDPYWVSAYPYRVDLRTNDTQTVQVTVRNFRNAPQTHRVVLRLPPGLEAEPAVLEGVVGPKSRQSFPVRLKVADRAVLQPGVRLVTMDITLDGKRYGEMFDFIVLGADIATPPAP
jgi:glyoxylase-like metal-dependent hydrolase (beta-lactamase superfamily II)